MDKSIIIKNFSRYAHLYDKYAVIQRESACELASQLKRNHLQSILEIGCGTGNYTLLLRDKFKQAKIKAVDISREMLAIAGDKLKGRDIEFILADAEELALNAEFDLITSNASFQWFSDLEKTLVKFAAMLESGGAIIFSIFGPRSLWQLNASLESLLKDISLASSNFNSKEKLEKMLQRYFKLVKIKEREYREDFPSLRALLEKIKYSGIRGSGLNGRVYLSRSFLERLEGIYLGKFKKIEAAYQVFFVQGIKK